MPVDYNSGTLTKYLNGAGIDNKLRQTTGTNTQYFLTDHLGSTNGLVDTSGNLTASTSYDAFGNAANTSFPNRYQFTGREYDNFTGLHYYRARFYDGNLGRFISEDPIGFGGGDENLYGYVRNNPAMMRDPSGKIPPVIIGVAVVGVLIITSPSYVNAPAPGDKTYSSQSPIMENALFGAVGGYLGGKFLGWAGSKICQRFGSKVGQLADEEMTIFRGVNQSNAAYDDALNGIAKPNGGNATPLEHNNVSTLNSPYTSWTTNPAVAENFALRPGGTPGVVLEANVPLSRIIASPNLKEVVLIQNGQVVSESEVLIQGIFKGAKVTKVPRR